ncbi:MAG: hypothetical protein ACYTAN_14610 [Planctomycetota bacterium]|jgi:hypothetical protein
MSRRRVFKIVLLSLAAVLLIATGIFCWLSVRFIRNAFEIRQYAAHYYRLTYMIATPRGDSFGYDSVDMFEKEWLEKRGFKPREIVVYLEGRKIGTLPLYLPRDFDLYRNYRNFVFECDGRRLRKVYGRTVPWYIRNDFEYYMYAFWRCKEVPDRHGWRKRAMIREFFGLEREQNWNHLRLRDFGETYIGGEEYFLPRSDQYFLDVTGFTFEIAFEYEDTGEQVFPIKLLESDIARLRESGMDDQIPLNEEVSGQTTSGDPE